MPCGETEPMMVGFLRGRVWNEAAPGVGLLLGTPGWGLEQALKWTFETVCMYFLSLYREKIRAAECNQQAWGYKRVPYMILANFFVSLELC